MADISQIKLPNGDIFDLVDESKSTATNWVNGSQTSSVRTVGSKVEDNDYIIGIYAVAEGSSTKASGYASHAEGSYTTASGDYSHTEGSGTFAPVSYAHAEGYNTTASGNYSHAEGQSTTASNYNAHAEGQETTASGSTSHAEGMGTAASGYSSHAEGYYTLASGDYSHAEGYGTTVSGLDSHAEGDYTIANHRAQHVFGRYNIADTSTATADNKGKYVEIVGNGSYNARSNARTLDWSGNEVLAGKLTVGAVGTNTMDVATIGQLPTKVSDLTNDSGFATTSYVDSAINALPEPMIFKGSVGTGGTITTLPTAAAANEGWTYKVITSLSSPAAKVGDTVISNGSNWVVIPSGDEPSGTVTSVGVSNATNGGLTISGSPITSSGTITIGHSNVLSSAQTTQAVYPIKIDKNGHISSYGTAINLEEMKFFLVTLTLVDENSGVYESDKTAKQIYDAFNAGRVVLLYVNGSYVLLSSVYGDGNYYQANFSESQALTGSFILYEYIIVTDNNVTSVDSNHYETPVNNATLTIQKNGTTIKSFRANASSDVTANITVPTKISELTNDSGFITSYTETDPVFSASAAAGITVADISNWNANIKPMLVGDTSTITPTQVATALANGQNIELSYTDATYGTGKAYSFNYSDSLHEVVANVIFRYNGGWICCEIHGNTQTNEWAFISTSLATLDDISAVTDEKLAISTANTGTAYYPILGNGTTAQTRQYTSNLEVVNAPGSTGAGYTRLTIGNTAVSNGARGWIRLTTGQNQHYIDIFSDQEMQSNTTVYFPKASGTLALTSDIPSIPSNIVNTITTTAGAHTTITNSTGDVSFSVPTKTSDLTNDSGFLTSYTETDPTVPTWAKASSKPSYTASEVGAVPTTRTVNGKALSSNITLTASDVSALPSSTSIPSATSDLTNDSGFITSSALPTNLSDLTNDCGFAKIHTSTAEPTSTDGVDGDIWIQYE